MGTFKRGVASRVRRAADDSNREAARPTKKSIRFAVGDNRVRYVHPPPRSLNKDYWFTETQRVVKKGLQFEIEPHVNTAVNVDCRLQLCTLSLSSACASSSSVAPTRGFVSILDEGVFTAHRGWLSLGSVAAGEMAAVKVVLPPGSYQLRCEGTHPIQIFAQAWDIERQLI